MAETYDFAHSDEYNTHMAEVHKYLSKVHAGRSLVGMDPNQPAFSNEAETLRQTGAIDRANRNSPQAGPDEHNAPESYDFSDAVGSQGFDFSSAEGDSVRSTGNPSEVTKQKPTLAERYRGYRPDYSKKPTRGPGSTEALDPIFQELMAPLAAGRDALLGGTPRELANKAFGDPSVDWKRNVLPGVMEGLLDIIPAAPLFALGGRGKPGSGPHTSPVAPLTTLTPEALDLQVAERSVTKPAFETGAYPDAELVPARKPETGRSLITPNLNQGELNPNSIHTRLPGEYGPGTEGQTSLLGGHNVLGNTSHLVGATPLEAGEQLPISALPLRPQVQYRPEVSAKGQQEYSDFITKALRSRLLTPQMERDLITNPAEYGNYPIEITISKGGSATAGPKVNESFKLPSEFNVSNTANGAVFPSKYARASGSVTDTMRMTGPIGNTMADLFDTAYANRAMGTSQDMISVTKKLDDIFGRSTQMQRLGTGLRQLAPGENPFIFGMRKTWNVTPETEEAIFNYMYTGRRMATSNVQAKEAAEALFADGTYPASSDPGVRMLTINNPFTGKAMPLGHPDMFMPQQPIHPITVKAISDTQWGILYQRAGGDKLGISLEQYKKTIVKLSQHDPEVTSFKMKGLENMRLLDLEALGGSPYQWAKKLGYETDPFRASFRFNSLARLRGQLAQIQEPVNQLLSQVPASADEAGKWLHLAADRAMMNPGKYDALTTTTNTLKGVSHLMDVSMLQLGGLANMAQASFIAARGGMRATIKGTFDMLTGKDRELIQRSGATFPAALNEMTNPTGPMAAFSSGAFRLYGLSLVDRNTRVFAGHVGNQFIKQIESNLLANPTSKRLQGLVQELGGDPKVLLAQGILPDQMRLSMIQRFANHTAGVTDVRGTPLWASSENPWARLVNKYRTFAVANSAEVRRLVINAPTPLIATERVAKLLAGAYVIGGGINEARKGLRDMLMGEEARPSKHGIAEHAERLVQGLGTMEGMFIVNAAKDPTTAVLSAVGGPAAGVTASFVQDMQSTARHGLGWRTIDTASKRIPIVGPVTGPLVGKQVRKESRQTAEDSRLLHE